MVEKSFRSQIQSWVIRYFSFFSCSRDHQIQSFKRHVLTSAECVLKNKRDIVDNPAEYNIPGNIWIKIGNTDRVEEEFYRVASSLHPYDEAFQDGYNYNIGSAVSYTYLFAINCYCLLSAAIIEMTDDVYFTKNTRPICLPRVEYQDKLGESGMMAGWGLDGRNWSNNLKVINVFILRNQDCKNMMDIQGKQIWQENDGLNFAVTKALSSR